MEQSITIAVDAIGGDHGVPVTVRAVLSALKQHQDISIILTGDEKLVKAELQHQAYNDEFSNRLHIEHASEVVTMDEEPMHALRRKRDSSMRVAIDLVRKEKASACVSGGNTGALMAISYHVLRTLPGIERPAIISMLPTVKGHTYMLDLGANIDSKAEQLFQFAVMGAVLAQTVDNIKSPRVALLNVGKEAIKGNDQIKAADAMLRVSSLNYTGYIEGNDLHDDKADVVVANGFVGNITLKAMEGTLSFTMHLIAQEFKRNAWTRFLGLLVKPIFRRIEDSVGVRKYNGASFVGLQGIVIKSHGRANAREFENAIRIARIEAIKQVPKILDKEIEAMLKGLD